MTPDYFLPGLPYLDGFKVTHIADNQTAEQAFLTKAIDGWMAPIQRLDPVKQSGGRSCRCCLAPESRQNLRDLAESGIRADGRYSGTPSLLEGFDRQALMQTTAPSGQPGDPYWRNLYVRRLVTSYPILS